ncbi:MAG: hypothetical protein LC808_41485 [Actinobacteria bacterium]|nr:hypothetical protein [Actinomycetota bacterium]
MSFTASVVVSPGGPHLPDLAALASHLAIGAAPALGITALLAGATAAGGLCGSLIAERLPQRALGRGRGFWCVA